MRLLLQMVGLLALGMIIGVVGTSVGSGFQSFGAGGRGGLDFASYGIGLAVGLGLVGTLRLNPVILLRWIAHWLITNAGVFRLAALALMFGGILVYY